MTSKQLTTTVAILYLSVVPFIFVIQRATQQVFEHPLGLFLLTPAGVLIANIMYTHRRLSKPLILFEGIFFVLWTLVCLSLYATLISTENGLGTLLGSFFNAIGMPYPEAEQSGWYLFVFVFVLSLGFLGISMLYAGVSRLNKDSPTT